MRADSLITLKIGQRRPADSTTTPDGLLERMLLLAGDILPMLDEAAERALEGELQGCRAALAADGRNTDAVTEDCLELLERMLGAFHAEHDERAADVGRLVAAIRDTVRLLMAEGTTAVDEFAHAANRFSALAHIGDEKRLRQQLDAEIAGLQRIASARSSQWRHSKAALETRIAALEGQLVAVRREASLDPLTGIFNRRHFERMAAEALRAPHRELVLAVIDLDDFKAVNDRGGHAAGDGVLQRVAQALRSSVGRQDIVARVGGDEFAILATESTLRDAEARIRTIIAALADVATGLDLPAQVSVSCGMAEYCAGDTLESMAHRADQGLYDAKRRGKNRVVVKSPPFIRDLLRRH